MRFEYLHLFLNTHIKFQIESPRTVEVSYWYEGPLNHREGIGVHEK